MTSDSGRSAAALDVLRTLAGSGGLPDGDPDNAVRTMLLGRPVAVTYELGGKSVQIDRVKHRHEDFQRVLEAQRIPSVSSLLRLHDALQGIASGKNAADLLKTVDTERAKLPVVDIPKTHLPGEGEGGSARYRTEKLAELTRSAPEKLSGKDRSQGRPKDCGRVPGESRAVQITWRWPASTTPITYAPTICAHPMARSLSASITFIRYPRRWPPAEFPIPQTLLGSKR